MNTKNMLRHALSVIFAISIMLNINPEAIASGLDNTGVTTTAPNNTVYRANGYMVTNDFTGETYNLSEITASRPGSRNYPSINTYSSEQARTFFITDLASREEGMDIIVYVAGLSFLESRLNPFDSNSQHSGLTIGGFPYSTVFSINTTTDEIRMFMCEPTLPIWVPIGGSGQFDESKVKLDDNSLYESQSIVDFVTPSITPKIITSKHDSETIYILVGEKGELSNTPHTEHNDVYLLKGNMRDGVTVDAKIDLDLFHTWNLTGRTHNIDHHMLYPSEQSSGDIAIASIGDDGSEVSISLLIDMVTNIQEMFVEAFWKDRNELLELARGRI